MRYILAAILVGLFPLVVEAKCVSGSAYTLKGYMEDANNIPQTGRTLTEMKFDVFYDDGTSSVGNNATAEMGQGWYRYSYTSNGKNGIWVLRDSTGVNKNFPGGILETLCENQVHTAIVNSIWDEAQAGHITAGTFGKYLDAQVSLVGGGGSSDWTAGEKANIRYRLGVDGTATAPVTNAPNLGTLTANVADKTGFSLAANQSGVTIGTVSTVTNPVTAGTNNDKTGYALSTVGVDAILDDTVEGSLTMRQMVKIMAAALAGKASGGGTTTITFTGLDGVTTRITATVDANGNRSAVTVNGN